MSVRLASLLVAATLVACANRPPEADAPRRPQSRMVKADRDGEILLEVSEPVRETRRE